MIEEKIWQCVQSLKEEDCYLCYLEANAALKENADLLLGYKRKKEHYLELKPYEKFQDLTDLREQVLELGSQVENLPAYQKYHQAKNALDARLQNLSHLIFDGLVDQSGGDTCEGHCRKI